MISCTFLPFWGLLFTINSHVLQAIGSDVHQAAEGKISPQTNTKVTWVVHGWYKPTNSMGKPWENHRICHRKSDIFQWWSTWINQQKWGRNGLVEGKKVRKPSAQERDDFLGCSATFIQFWMRHLSQVFSYEHPFTRKNPKLAHCNFNIVRQRSETNLSTPKSFQEICLLPADCNPLEALDQHNWTTFEWYPSSVGNPPPFRTGLGSPRTAARPRAGTTNRPGRWEAPSETKVRRSSRFWRLKSREKKMRENRWHIIGSQLGIYKYIYTQIYICLTVLPLLGTSS